jgi:hypothetical protein
VGTVPGTVPGVVSTVTPKGSPESTLNPARGPIGKAKPTVTCQPVPQGTSGLSCHLILKAICQPSRKATAEAVARAVCGRTCRATFRVRHEASLQAPMIATATFPVVPAVLFFHA